MSVLVTVAGSHGRADLELDDTRPVSDLLEHLTEALAEPSPAVALRTAEGADLASHLTLADAGVLDGHRLTLVPGADPSAASAGATGSTASAGPPVLACYLALDSSDSMTGAPLDALNVELARLMDAVRSDPQLGEACRLAVVTFDAEARVHVPLTPVSALGRSPRLAATRPATNFEAAFRLLRRQIMEDLDSLRAAGRRPLRPAVFLLTDGRPTRGHWAPAHAALTDPSWPDAPDLVAFGFGDAAAPALRRIGTAGAYLPAVAPGIPKGGPAGMLAALMAFLLDALRGSLGEASSRPIEGSSQARATTAIDLPRDPPRGWRSLDEARL